MRSYLRTGVVMLLILASIAALSFAVMAALTSFSANSTDSMLGGSIRPFGPIMDTELSRLLLAGVTWVALLVLWSIVATVMGGALYRAARTTNETARHLENRSGLRRRYSPAELEAQEYDPIDLDRAA